MKLPENSTFSFRRIFACTRPVLILYHQLKSLRNASTIHDFEAFFRLGQSAFQHVFARSCSSDLIATQPTVQKMWKKLRAKLKRLKPNAQVRKVAMDRNHDSGFSTM